MANTIDTNTLLLQLRSLARESGLPPSGDLSTRPAADALGGLRPAGGAVDAEAVPGVPTDFGALIGDSLSAVNARSQEASRMRSAYEAGHPDVELADVMIAVQKARVSFEALTQVRNKMVAAYQDVMNTPI